MEHCKEKFNNYSPVGNLKFIIKDGDIICLTSLELYNLYRVASRNVGYNNYITISFPNFGNIKLRNFKTLALYLAENNIFEIKLRSDEVRKMQVLPTDLENVVGKMIGDLYEIIAKEDDSENVIGRNFNLRDKVNEILDIDNKFRFHGVDQDLYVIDDIFNNDIKLYNDDNILLVRNRSWGGYIFKTDNPLISGTKTKWENYINRILPEFDYENILIAGGHICSFLKHPEVYNIDVDIDLFIYGIKDKNQANKRVEKIINYFNNNNNTWGVYSINISKNCISLLVGNYYGNKMRIDIVLRLYNTKSEILHGFDLGPAAIGWDGKEILFTTLSKFTYEYKTIIVDLSRRSTTFEKRLVKYVERTGFNIIFPDFNMDKINDYKVNNVNNENERERRIYDMNYIKLILFSGPERYLKDIKVSLNVIGAKNPGLNLLTFHNNSKNNCDYKPSSGENHNIKCLLNDDLENLYLKVTQWNGLKINGKLIRGKFNMETLKKLDELIDEEHLINYYIKEIQKINLILSGEINSNIIKENIRKLKKNIRKINEKSKKSKKSRINLIHWNIENPTTQLTSSINPLIKDPKDWYGKFY